LLKLLPIPAFQSIVIACNEIKLIKLRTLLSELTLTLSPESSNLSHSDEILSVFMLSGPGNQLRNCFHHLWMAGDVSEGQMEHKIRLHSLIPLFFNDRDESRQ
jgi:hypothetical protein